MTIDTRPRRHPYTARHNTYPSPGHSLRPVGREVALLDMAPVGPTGEVAPAVTTTAPAVREERELFVDPTSPWAFLAHLRLGASAAEGDGPSWAVVQRWTTIPFTGQRGPSPERDQLREELAAVRAAAQEGEELPDEIPAVLPNPRPVLAAYAEAVDLGVGPAVRDRLLRAYWLEGLDIGSPDVLRNLLPPLIVSDDTLCTGDPRREFGYLVSPQREPLTNQAYHQLERWQKRWTDLGQPGPLALVDGDGAVHTGVKALTT